MIDQSVGCTEGPRPRGSEPRLSASRRRKSRPDKARCCLFSSRRWKMLLRASITVIRISVFRKIFQRQAVFYRSHHPTGTIVIETSERHLYLIESETRALRYGIGVGRDGFTWAGLFRMTRKAEWPDWHPPPESYCAPALVSPRFMAGGLVIPWALARSTWETPFTASMAPPRRRPSATQFRAAVFV